MTILKQSLNEIGVEFGTDKSTIFHDYLGFYENTLRDLRDSPVLLFEIGVFEGGSVRMWEKYFQAGTIVGLDIDPQRRWAESGRVKIRIGDASRLEFLDQVIAEFGLPDIVIDDGSHRWDHQIETLKYLFPRVKPGGYYIMEDLHTSFPGMAAEYRGASSISGFDYLQQMTRQIVNLNADIGEVPFDGFIDNYRNDVSYISYFRRTAAIKKK